MDRVRFADGISTQADLQRRSLLHSLGRPFRSRGILQRLLSCTGRRRIGVQESHGWKEIYLDHTLDLQMGKSHLLTRPTLLCRIADAASGLPIHPITTPSRTPTCPTSSSSG